jgi:hypothetical protein
MSITVTEPRDLGIQEPNKLLIKEARRKGRWRHLRGSFIVLAVLLVAVLLIIGWGGRTSPSKLTTGDDAKSPASTARFLCHDALGGRALNSAAEKLGTVRQFGYGPTDIQPAANAFKSLGPSQIVGVCWTGTPSAGYELYAVATGYKPVRIEGVEGIGFKSSPKPGFVDIP